MCYILEEILESSPTRPNETKSCHSIPEIGVRIRIDVCEQKAEGLKRFYVYIFDYHRCVSMCIQNC